MSPRCSRPRSSRLPPLGRSPLARRRDPPRRARERGAADRARRHLARRRPGSTGPQRVPAAGRREPHVRARPEIAVRGARRRRWTRYQHDAPAAVALHAAAAGQRRPPRTARPRSRRPRRVPAAAGHRLQQGRLRRAQPWNFGALLLAERVLGRPRARTEHRRRRGAPVGRDRSSPRSAPSSRSTSRRRTSTRCSPTASSRIADTTLSQTEELLRQTHGGAARRQPERVRAAARHGDARQPAPGELIARRGERDIAYLRLKQLLNLPLDAPLALTTPIDEPATITRIIAANASTGPGAPLRREVGRSGGTAPAARHDDDGSRTGAPVRARPCARRKDSCASRARIAFRSLALTSRLPAALLPAELPPVAQPVQRELERGRRSSRCRCSAADASSGNIEVGAGQPRRSARAAAAGHASSPRSTRASRSTSSQQAEAAFAASRGTAQQAAARLLDRRDPLSRRASRRRPTSLSRGCCSSRPRRTRRCRRATSRWPARASPCCAICRSTRRRSAPRRARDAGAAAAAAAAATAAATTQQQQDH